MAIKDLTKLKFHLFICNGGTCKLKGAEESTLAIREEIEKAGLNNVVHTTKTLCNGRCEDGPIVIVGPENIWYKEFTDKEAPQLIKDHLRSGKMLQEKILYRWGINEMNVNQNIDQNGKIIESEKI